MSRGSLARTWAGRLGKYVFLFYLIKGLVWLGIFGAAALGVTRI